MALFGSGCTAVQLSYSSAAVSDSSTAAPWRDGAIQQMPAECNFDSNFG
jgi:hypothetical protein